MRVAACMYAPHVSVCLVSSCVSVWTDVCECMCVHMCVSCMHIGTPGWMPAWPGLAWHGQQWYGMARPGHSALLYAYTTKPTILMSGAPSIVHTTSPRAYTLCTRTWMHTCVYNVLHTHACSPARPHPYTIACIDGMHAPTYNIIHNHHMGARTYMHTHAWAWTTTHTRAHAYSHMHTHIKTHSQAQAHPLGHTQWGHMQLHTHTHTSIYINTCLPSSHTCIRIHRGWCAGVLEPIH